MSRDGGYETVNASGYSAKADGPDSFRFGGGPVRRYVGMADFPSGGEGAVVGYNATPSVVGDPPNTKSMLQWLTGDQHAVPMSESAVAPITTRIETFASPAPGS